MLIVGIALLTAGYTAVYVGVQRLMGNAIVVSQLIYGPKGSAALQARVSKEGGH